MEVFVLKTKQGLGEVVAMKMPLSWRKNKQNLQVSELLIFFLSFIYNLLPVRPNRILLLKLCFETMLQL